ncbi:MAG: cadherin repeat domain-containing protein, partial [Pseudomonadota bacterium]
MASDNLGVASFEITGGDAAGFFAIDDGGALSLSATGIGAAANDFEAVPSTFDLTITVRDAAGNTGSGTVALTLRDLDEVLPVVAADQAFAYDENQAAGFAIGIVAATDNAAVTGFDITGGDALGFFSIDDAGGLSLTAAGAAAAANDFETLPNEFPLTVTARDAAGNEGTATAIVSVEDVDDTPPTITNGQTFSYDENRDAGFAIGMVAARDNVAITGFDITDGDPLGFFAIDNAGGLSLTAAGAASAANDFEALPNDRVLTITARDAAGNEDVETVSLALTDLDDTVVDPGPDPMPGPVPDPGPPSDQNAAPVAVDDLFQRSTLAPFSGNLLSDNGAGADRDPEGGALSLLLLAGAAPGASVVLPSGASVSGTATGAFDYDPGDAFADLAPGETGTDSFAYVIVDDGNATASAVADIRFALPGPLGRKIGDENDNLWTLQDMLTACTVEGRGGIDTVVLPGALADFRIERLEEGFRFVDAGLDGAAPQDLLSVERIQFDDAELNLETDSALIETALLYDFLLDRFPERAGLSFWSEAAEAGLSLAAIGERFLDSIEFQDRFAGPQEN